jgi:hypothetical protein
MKPTNQQEVDRYWAAEMGAPSQFHSMPQAVHFTIQQIYPARTQAGEHALPVIPCKGGPRAQINCRFWPVSAHLSGYAING